jgi:hypothetical protein
MKKFLALTLLLGASLFAIPSVEAAANNTGSINNSVSPQISVRIGRRQPRWGRTRSYIRTRNVRVGFRLYRETYRVTVNRNGRTSTQLISRVRVR